MQSLEPEHAILFLHLIQPSLNMEHGATKRVLQAVPADRGDNRPDPVSKSALELAWHIAATDVLFLDAVSSGEFHFEKNQRPESIRNSADVVKWYRERWEQTFERVTQLSGEQLAKPINFRGVWEQPAVLFLRMGVSHTIHHRGQLSVCLRPMGAKVPSIYGESYDDAQARKAAEGQTSSA